MVDKDVCCYSVYLRDVSDSLEQVKLIADEIARPWSSDYIWQSEAFDLIIEDDHLTGRTHFGDCIEDEWFIVWILRELSRKADVLVQIWDTDGEFLLIESAMHLPRWLDPDTATNRAWIVDGHLKIIEPSTEDIDAKPCPELSLSEAITYLRSGQRLLTSDEIEADAFSRIAKYPEQSRIEMHRVECILPRAVATILYHKPALISSAVTEYYQRIPEQDSSLAEIGIFEFVDLVNVVVKMTRTLYAQLKGQRFEHKHEAGSKSEEVGYQITCGFELLAQRNVDIQVDGVLLSDEMISTFSREVDSDAFLEVNLEDLEDLSQAPPAQGESVSKIIEQMQKFMDTEAGLEGVDLDDAEEDDSDNAASLADSTSSDEDDFMTFLRSPLTKPIHSHPQIPLSQYMAEMDAELSHRTEDRKAGNEEIRFAENLSEALESGDGPASNLFSNLRSSSTPSGSKNQQ